MTETENRKFVPEYTDVFIDRDTCEIFKHYSPEPSTYFFTNKAINVNLKWPERYGSRSVNITVAYKKAFGVGFTGSIVARQKNTLHVVRVSYQSGKITGTEIVLPYNRKYHTPEDYSNELTELGKREYEPLFKR